MAGALHQHGYWRYPIVEQGHPQAFRTKPSEQSLQDKAFRRFFVPQPAISPNNVAVITGGASGIGLAAATRFARLGMNVCIADHDASRLREAGRQLSGVAQAGAANVMIKAVDVSRFEDVTELEHAVRERFGGTDVLLNNAGIQPGSQMFGPLQNWQRILGVNLWGVIHGSQVFAPGMIERGRPGLIINTGSKQGITTPPGDPAYNVSKAGVKAFTEALQHELRNAARSKISAHLFIPGFVFTGLTSRGRTEKPDAAWTPEQTVDFMIERVQAGDFYILCPDNDVPRKLDERRILWAAGDIVENRPALSRWHPDYAEAFAAFVKKT
jgi:NAD(P)-dependent dehydrogenase (short-subunit alcohol dehydrogenase family)